MTNHFKITADIGYVVALGDSLFVDECLEVRHSLGSTYTFLDRHKAEALKKQAAYKYKGLELRVMQITRADSFSNASHIGRVYDPGNPDCVYDIYANGDLLLNDKSVDPTLITNLIPYNDEG